MVDKKTFPALTRRMAFVPADQVLEVATAVIKVQRDFGNRTNRNLARLKYLVAAWGVSALPTSPFSPTDSAEDPFFQLRL